MKLYVFGSKRVGGVRIATLSLFNSLNSLGYEVEYIFGFRVFKLYFLSFIDILRGCKNDFYFITWGVYNLLPFPRKRTLCFLHGFPSYNQQDFFRYILFRFIIFLNKFRKIKTISISKYSQSILQDIFKLKTTLIRNSVPLYYLKDFRFQDFEKDIDIIFVGRANKFKLPIYILKCLELLANNGFNIYVIGDGESKENYLKNNFKTRINFLSFVSHEKVLKFLKRSKFFISCSNSEPFGLVFLEAILYGCKTISPRSGGLLEISSLFPAGLRDLFTFYDDDKNAKEILLGLDFSSYIHIKEDIEFISKILEKNFNPLNHAREVIKIIKELNS